MATLSFRKLGSTASFPTSGMTEGTIYFCPKEHTIGIATGATTVEKYYGGNVKDAKYANNKLTITYNDGTTTAELDFSDMASAKAIAEELASLKALHAKNGDSYKTVDAEITGRLAGLNLSEVKNASGYISAVSQSNGVVAATAKAFDATIPTSDPSASNAPTTKAVKDYVDGKATSTTSGLKYEDKPVTGQYVSEVNQTNGIISVKRVALPSLNDTITSSSNDDNAPTTGAVKTYVTEEIAGAKSSLDFTDDVTGNYVTSISRADGTVTIRKSNFDTTIPESNQSTTTAPTSKAVADYVSSEITKLGNSLTFKGAYKDSEIQDGLSGAFDDGDVVIATDTAKEYVRYNGGWRELGNEGQAAAIINGLNVTDTAVDGQYVSKVDQVDGVIAPVKASFAADVATGGNTAPKSSAVKTYVDGKINALDLGQVGAAGQYVSAVSQADGKVTASATAFDKTISAASTDNNAPTSKAVYTYVNALNTAIANLDLTQVGAAGKYIAYVSQENGQVAAIASDFDKAIPAEAPSESTAPTTKAVKSYVDTEVSKAVGGALVWSSWE